LFEFLGRHRRLVQAALVILVLLAVAGAVRFLPIADLAQWLAGRPEVLGWWAPVLFVLLFVGLAVVLLPAWPLNVAAGVMFGPVLGSLMTCLASNTAAAVSFLIGRALGRRKAARLVQRYPKLDAVYQTLRRGDSWKLVAAVRLSHALPFGLQNFLLGASPVRFWTYLLTTIAVTLPGICVVTYLGYLGGAVSDPNRADSPLRWWLLRGGGLLVAAAAIFYLGRTVRRAIGTPRATVSECEQGRGS
jgi:uncharacterized membrane protein YdjX (TVP38/TMEM64 family)